MCPHYQEDIGKQHHKEIQNPLAKNTKRTVSTNDKDLKLLVAVHNITHIITSCFIALFLNDLEDYLKENGALGIDLWDIKICSLLYADV